MNDTKVLSNKPSRMMRFLSYFAAFGALFWAAIGYVVADQSHIDAYLHYFGGIVERTSTYTNTAALNDLAMRNKVEIPPEGIYGAPSLIALIFVPLSLLPFKVATYAWLGVMMTALAISTRKAAGQMWGIWLLLLISTWPWFDGILLGNPSIITFSLVAYAFGTLKDASNNEDSDTFHNKWSSQIAGVCIGAAAILKFYPAFLLIVFIAHRNWRALKWSIGTMAVLTGLSVVIMTPHDAYIAFKTTLEVARDIDLRLDNISLTAQLGKIIGGESFTRVTNIAVLGTGAVLLALKPTKQPHRTLAIATGVMLLGQSLTWVHYLTLTLLMLVTIRELLPNKLSLYIAFAFAAVNEVLLPTEVWQRKAIMTISTTILFLILLILTSRHRRSQIESDLL